MNELRRKLMRFGLQFVPLFLVCVGLYMATFSTYESLAVGTANVVTDRLSPPTRVEVQPNGEWRAFRFTPQEGKHRIRIWTASTSHLMLLSLALLPPLLLATPAPIRTRFKLLGIAMPLLFAVHVLSIIGLTRGVQCLAEAPGTFHCLWLLRLVYSSGQLFAAALWVLLTWRYWISSRATETA